jgi:hypothetical protein
VWREGKRENETISSIRSSARRRIEFGGKGDEKMKSTNETISSVSAEHTDKRTFKTRCSNILAAKMLNMRLPSSIFCSSVIAWWVHVRMKRKRKHDENGADTHLLAPLVVLLVLLPALPVVVTAQEKIMSAGVPPDHNSNEKQKYPSDGTRPGTKQLKKR